MVIMRMLLFWTKEQTKMPGFLNLGIYWLAPQYGVNNFCVWCKVKAKKANKNIQQRTLLGFITIPLY